MATGVYIIQVTSTKQAWVVDPLKGIALTEGKRTVAPDVHARAGAVVEVTAVDAETGAPVPNAFFALSLARNARNAYAGRGWTDKDGHLLLRTLWEGAMTLSSQSTLSGYLRMKESEAIPVNLSPKGNTVNLVVKLHKGMTLTGMVIDGAGQPAAGVDCAITMPDGYSRFTSDRFGKFEVSGVPAGKGTLTLDNRHPSEWELSPLQTVDVPAEKPIVVNVTRLPLHSVTGRVVDAQNHPVAGVIAALSMPFRQGWAPKVFTVITGPDGGYQLANIPVGHRVSLLRLNKDGYRQPITGTLANDDKDTIADAVLGDALLEGTVVDAVTQQPLAGMPIAIYQGKTRWDNGHTDYRGHFFLPFPARAIGVARGRRAERLPATDGKGSGTGEPAGRQDDNRRAEIG